MSHSPTADRSNGYDAAADEFISRRSASSIGVRTVTQWARTVPAGGAILDLGCGNGMPIAQTLAAEDFVVYGVDASPRMIESFRKHLPHVFAECCAVEASNLFNRTFEGVIAWGLIFLLAPELQAQVIDKVAGVLEPGGQFLFTAPSEICEWPDVLTGRKSVSLGSDRYRQLVVEAGMVPSAETEDEGGNHYYFVSKPDDYAGAV